MCCTTSQAACAPSSATSARPGHPCCVSHKKQLPREPGSSPFADCAPNGRWLQDPSTAAFQPARRSGLGLTRCCRFPTRLVLRSSSGGGRSRGFSRSCSAAGAVGRGGAGEGADYWCVGAGGAERERGDVRRGEGQVGVDAVTDNGGFMGTCPDCGSQLKFAEGCVKCHVSAQTLSFCFGTDAISDRADVSNANRGIVHSPGRW
jgi:hypothetical protein